jgi:histidine triad (HIT) family protein
MDDCIFCKIVSRKADALILYESESVISFLPLRPEVYGHTLIAPKSHYADIYEIPDDSLNDLIAAAKTHALSYRARIGATGINLMHASGKDGEQSVFHFHFHLLPRFHDDGLKTWPMLPGTNISREAMHAMLRI